jgi:hypothetical protein
MRKEFQPRHVAVRNEHTELHTRTEIALREVWRDTARVKVVLLDVLSVARCSYPSAPWRIDGMQLGDSCSCHGDGVSFCCRDRDRSYGEFPPISGILCLFCLCC